MNLMEDGEPPLCGLAYLGHHISSFTIHLEKARHTTQHTHVLSVCRDASQTSISKFLNNGT